MGGNKRKLDLTHVPTTSVKQDKKSDDSERIDMSVIDYLKHVSEKINVGFEDEEEKIIFIRNVFFELDGHEIKLSCHQTHSKTLESLIDMADLEAVCKFAFGLNQDMHGIATHWIGSHVIQCVFNRIRVLCESSSLEKDLQEEVLTTVARFCDIFKSSFHEFVQHTYASHVLRSLLEMLTGVYVSPHVTQSKGKKGVAISVPRDYYLSKNTDMITRYYDICDKVFVKATLYTFLTNTNSSVLLQSAIRIMHEINKEKCDEYCSRIVKLLTESENSNLVCCDSSSRAIEVTLSMLSPDLMELLVAPLFIPNMHKYSQDKNGNFVLQRLINCCSKKTFNKIFRNIQEYIEDILAVGHTGLIVALAKGCVTHSTQQKSFYKCLRSAFHCSEADAMHLAAPLLTLMTYDVYYEEKRDLQAASINLHGCVIVETLLQFMKPKVAESILEIDGAGLKVLACHASGSHVLDSFMTSTTVVPDQKQRLTNKFMGVFPEVACSKYGSRTLETMWKRVSAEDREKIASELTSQSEKVKNNRFGQFVHRNFRLDHFLVNKHEWLSNERNRQEREKKLVKFVKVLNESSGL